jgi:hypothetical protein
MLPALRGRLADAARIDGAARTYPRRTGCVPEPSIPPARARVQACLDAAGATAEQCARRRHEGEALNQAALARLIVGEPGADA